MSRGSTLNVSLTPRQLRQVRQFVERGAYGSASEVVREGLRLLFDQKSSSNPSTAEAHLAAAYRACARRDRKMAHDWSPLEDEWPDE